MEEYPYRDEMNDVDERGQVRASHYHRRSSGIGDTVAEQRVYPPDVRRGAPIRRPPVQPPPEEGMLSRLARGVARIFAVLFLAAGIGMWMVYFGAMYVLGLLGEPAMLAEDVMNDLLFGLLSTLIALVLLVWSRSERAA